MKTWFFILISVGMISCKKEKADFVFSDKWVENTLRLDTIEFNSPLSSSTQSIYYNVNSPSKNLYTYRLKTDSIQLLSFVSSSMIPKSFYFKATSTDRFTIGNFFLRSSLPATVEFVRLR